MIYHAIATTSGATLIVQLQYAGHPSMITFLISAGNERGNNVTFVQSTAVSSNLNNYMFELPLPPGVYRFIVRASNTFGSTGWSEEFPSIGFRGLYDFIKSYYCLIYFFNPVTYIAITNGTSTVVLPTSTIVVPVNKLASCNAVGIGLGSGLGVCLIISAIQFAALLVISFLYITKGHNASKGLCSTKHAIFLQSCSLPVFRKGSDTHSS